MTLTQADLQAIGTLVTEAIKPLSTKEDVYSTKMELYDELNRQYTENEKRFAKLESMAAHCFYSLATQHYCYG